MAAEEKIKIEGYGGGKVGREKWKIVLKTG